MQIVEKNINDLIPYENNPRRNDEAVEYVSKSIKRFGFKVPILIDGNNVVIAGHTRLKAAKKIGFKIVPCIIAEDLSDEQVKAFRLVDNKIAEFSDWDNDKLQKELEQMEEGSVDEFGFLERIYDDMQDLFQEAENSTGEKKIKKFVCPCCGKEVITDKDYNVISNEDTTD